MPTLSQEEITAMLDNEYVVTLLKNTAQLLELHGANPFQVRHYNQVAWKLENLRREIAHSSLEAISVFANSEPSVVKLIQEIHTTGTLERWEKLNVLTPQGLREILSLQGIGPQKARVLWKKLGIESLAALQHACEEGHVAQLPGFGKKTQADIQKSLAFKRKKAGQFHYTFAIGIADELTESFKSAFPHCLISMTGALRRKMEVVDRVELLIGTAQSTAIMQWLDQQPVLKKGSVDSDSCAWQGQLMKEEIPLRVSFCLPKLFYQQLILHTGSKAHLVLPVSEGRQLSEAIKHVQEPPSEAAAYEQIGLPYIPPELREGQIEIAWAHQKKAPKLLEMDDLQGVFHIHTTYSDGKHSLKEMALCCKDLGYKYVGITDHSQYAGYAGGLTPSVVFKQHQEIDHLNQQLAPFKIFKGIEADVLKDGSLDYEDDILGLFDFVIASVHTGSDKRSEKATERIIKAVYNPYTTILAHPTNRLLLKREGFLIDHQAVIDACAECSVVIEINSNPWRLELDWRWVDYALSKNVWISINPDAHDKKDIQNMHYGVYVGRKGGLTKAHTFNALPQEEIAKYVQHRRSKTRSAGFKH